MTTRVKRDFANEDWDHYYRRYQTALAERYLIPALSRWGVRLSGGKFLEVGCGDGGCGAAFYRAGCDVVMMDIDPRLVEIAERLNREEGIEAKAYVGDVLDERAAFYEEGPFDLVMFRDVMEHLDRPERALGIVRERLSGNGVVFVVFPPYCSAYGAHQQILPRKSIGPLPYNKLPFIQLLPRRWFLSLTAGDTAPNREVARLSGIRLTIRRFERAVGRSGLAVKAKKFFLSRPTFSLRYGVPALGAGPLANVPGLRELLVTGAYYLLERVDVPGR
ncbi:MAG: methyltransferase domain-containing protein [bacterium]